MAKTTTAKRSPAKAKAVARRSDGESRSGSGRAGGKSGSGKSDSGINGAADALVKLLESPLVAELLALGASAALASFTAQRFRSADDGRSTRRALKAAVKSAGAAMGHRIATEFDEIRKSAKQAREAA